MSGENPTPNFFILLGLDPNERWDQAKFEQVLREKRIEWSRQGSGVAKKALIAKKNLELLPEIRRVMEDPALREGQAQAARAAQVSERNADLERFERELAYLNAKEYVEQNELEAFVKEFHVVLPEKEIRARVKVPVKTANSTSSNTIPLLDTSVAHDITQKLTFLGLADLYALLGRPSTTSSPKLYKAAEELYAEMVRRQPKTAEVTARSDLAGHARNIFKSNEARKRYDETLRQQSLTVLLKDLEASVNRTTEKEVHEKQVQTFLQEAHKAGWSNEQALVRLKEHARQRKWLMQLPANEKTSQGLRCGYCHEINEVGRNFCRTCNKELLLTCSNCHHQVRTDEVGCGHCGFPVGNRYWIDILLERFTSTKDLAQAQELLREAEELWKPSQADERIQKIAQYKATLQHRVQEQQHALEELRQRIEQRRFVAAQQFLAANVGSIIDHKTYQRRIEQAISQAQDIARQARLPSSSQKERMRLCREALRICADYKEARDLLSTMPPEPPKNLRARIGENIVNLEWESSPTEDVSYRIIRKNLAQPVSIKDGVMLDTTTGPVYDDTLPEIGLPLYYAVFAEYEGISSTRCAILREPVFLTQEIKRAVVKVSDQRIELSWQVPAHVHAVIVVRKEQVPPNSMEDGKRLSVIHNDHLVDEEVQNERTYYYGISCQFKNHLGQLITSASKIISAIPETPPAPITQIEIIHEKTSQGYVVQLNWSKPAKGRAVVLKTERPLLYKMGEAIQAAQLSSYGQVLEGQKNTLTDIWTGSGEGYYIPVVLFADMAYIGEARHYSCVDDVSNVQYENLGTALRLRWVWPKDCQEVVVSYSSEQWPGANGVLAVTRHVTRAEYDTLGCFDIREAPDRDYYISIAATVGRGNKQIASPGVRVHARLATKIVLTYEIKQAGFLNRHKRTLHIHARKPGVLPTLLVISSRGRLPLHKSEGELLFRLDGPISIHDGLTIELPGTSFPPKTFGKLYLDDDTAYEFVQIHHPAEDKLRLG